MVQDGHTPDRQGRQTGKKTSIETERVKVIQIPFLAVVVDFSVFDFIVLHKHFPYVRRTLLSPPPPSLGLAPSVCKFHRRNLCLWLELRIGYDLAKIGLGGGEVCTARERKSRM